MKTRTTKDKKLVSLVLFAKGYCIFVLNSFYLPHDINYKYADINLISLCFAEFAFVMVHQF